MMRNKKIICRGNRKTTYRSTWMAKIKHRLRRRCRGPPAELEVNLVEVEAKDAPTEDIPNKKQANKSSKAKNYEETERQKGL